MVFYCLKIERLFFKLTFDKFGEEFNQLSGDITIFIVVLLWSELHAVEGTQVGTKMYQKWKNEEQNLN